MLATQAKDRGNECFKAGDLNNALKYYGISIKLYASANAYNNRAMTCKFKFIMGYSFTTMPTHLNFCCQI